MAMTRHVVVRPFPRPGLPHHKIVSLAIAALMLGVVCITAALALAQPAPQPWSPAPRMKHSPRHVPVASQPGCTDWLLYKSRLEQLASDLTHMHRVGLVPGDRGKGSTGDDVGDSLQEAATILKGQAKILTIVCGGEAKQ